MIVADREIDRRMAQGDVIGNPAGYRRSRLTPITRDHQDTWNRLLDDHPDMLAVELADQVAPAASTPPTQPSPYDGQAQALRARMDNPTTGCPDCHGSGQALDDDGYAVPCDHPQLVP